MQLETVQSQNTLLRSELDRVIHEYTACEKTLSRLQSDYRIREKQSADALESARSTTIHYRDQVEFLQSRVKELESELARAKTTLSASRGPVSADTPAVAELYNSLQEAQQRAQHEIQERQKVEAYLAEICRVLEEKQPVLALLQDTFSSSDLSQRNLNYRLSQSQVSQSQLVEAENKINVLSSVIENQKVQIAHLLGQKSQDSPRIADVAVVFSDFKELADRNADLLLYVKQMEQEITSSRDVALINDLQKSVNESKSVIEHYKQELSLQTTRVRELETELASFKTMSVNDFTRTKIGHQVTVTVPLVVELQDKIKSLEIRNNELQSRHESLITTVDQLRGALSDTRQDAADLRRENNTLRASDLEVRKAYHDATMAFNSQNQMFQQANSLVENLKRQVADLNNEKAQISSQSNNLIEDLKKQVQVAINEKSQINSQLNEVINDLRGQIQILNSEKSQISTQSNLIVEDLKKQVEVLNNEKTQISIQSNTLIEELRRQIQTLNKSQTDMSSQSNGLVEDLKSQISNLNQEKAQIKSQLSVKINELNKQIEMLNSEKTKISSQLNNNINDLKNQIKILKEKPVSFVQPSQEKSSEVEDKSSKIEELEGIIEHLESDYQELSKELKQKTSEYENLLERSKKVQSNALKWKNKAIALETEQGGDSIVSSIEYEQLEILVTKLRDISKLKSNLVSALKNRLTAATSSVATSSVAVKPPVEKEQVPESMQEAVVPQVSVPISSGFEFKPTIPIVAPLFPETKEAGTGGFEFKPTPSAPKPIAETKAFEFKPESVVVIPQEPISFPIPPQITSIFDFKPTTPAPSRIIEIPEDRLPLAGGFLFNQVASMEAAPVLDVKKSQGFEFVSTVPVQAPQFTVPDSNIISGGFEFKPLAEVVEEKKQLAIGFEFKPSSPIVPVSVSIPETAEPMSGGFEFKPTIPSPIIENSKATLGLFVFDYNPVVETLVDVPEPGFEGGFVFELNAQTVQRPVTRFLPVSTPKAVPPPTKRSLSPLKTPKATSTVVQTPKPATVATPMVTRSQTTPSRSTATPRSKIERKKKALLDQLLDKD
ncbi:hypothetical protein RCL1_006675 [Eukaryota sp. TZLM3-RCL]